jgi:hypothetical protein
MRNEKCWGSIWALLKNVDMEVKRGEALALIERNRASGSNG